MKYVNWRVQVGSSQRVDEESGLGIVSWVGERMGEKEWVLSEECGGRRGSSGRVRRWCVWVMVGNNA